VVEFSTLLGTDELGWFAAADLQAAGVRIHVVNESARPTTNKNAFIADGYRLLKVDRLDNRTITDDTVARLAADLREIESDAVVFSDFRHGIFNRRTIPRLVEAIRAPFRVADSQVASRWGNITDFQGFDLITPNEREARFALADQESGIRPLASSLYKAAGCKTLMLKMGERGMLTCAGGDHEDLDAFAVLDSFSGHVVDAVGAGDALLAYATLAMLVSGSVVEASIIGSVAAALECEAEGNVPITPNQVRDRLHAVEREANYGSRD
jgi:bifunctional ADP-heptose synthase (sugar kinase/adenylyltransferase)